MPISLDKRNKRALIILAAAAILILVFYYVTGPCLDEWRRVRLSLTVQEQKLAMIKTAHGSAELIPAFEMPLDEDQQRPLFYRKITGQFKKAGVNVNPLPQYVSRGRKLPNLSLKVLRLRCRGGGKYDQILQLIADLNKNPYLAGIEEFKIVCEKEKREKMSLDLTVSTFVK